MKKLQKLMRMSLLVVLAVSARTAYSQTGTEVIEMNATSYFSSNYKQARQKFLDAARIAKATIESLENPAMRPDAEPLFTDVALIGNKECGTVIVLISGTHGVEGFFGSAAQTGLLHEGIASNLPPDTSILMIHALNPFGFARVRRFNEDNIDVNRNFLDHSKPHLKNHEYEKMSKFFAPKSMNILSRIFFWPRLLWYKATGQTEAIQQAFSGGQYSYPKGLFYGGTFETWSNLTIRSIVDRYLSDARRVIIIDFHTGLGTYGDYEMIMQHPEESITYRRAVAIWGSEKVITTHDAESDPGEQSDADDLFFAELSGPMKLIFPGLLPNAEVTAVTMEQGASTSTKVFLALREENWLHHYGDSTTNNGKRTKAKLLQTFYPDDDEWREMVWLGAKRVVYQAIESGSK